MDTLENDVFFINSISGLRKANNKIYPATLANMHSEIDKSKDIFRLPPYRVTQNTSKK